MSILQVGSTINNYKIVKVLGKSQLGNTFFGQHILFDQTTGKPIIKEYTIKTINLDRAQEIGFDSETLVQEARVLKQMSENPLCDDYISCYYDYFIHNVPAVGEIPAINYLIIVTDYIKGKSLQQIILEQIDTKQPFDTNKLLQMIFEISQAVDYIHTHGVAHQNIKPSNIIYDLRDMRLKLVDFSLSCSKHLNVKCKGKPGAMYYMPPELLETPLDPSQQNFSFRMMHDIWSIGVIFFQMANLGRNYMNFIGNDPEQIKLDIITQSVNVSNFSYVPINSVILSILNKDYSKRPTAGQIVILIRLARPLCIVNGKPYDRQESEALIISLGLDTDPNTDDYILCNTLTSYLNNCKIKNNNYQKNQLLALAKILGINSPKDIESSMLCTMIQKGLETQRELYSKHITQEIQRAIKYMSWLKVRSAGDTSGKLKDILKTLTERYIFVYSEAKRLSLLNLKQLEAYRQFVSLKSEVYKQTSSIGVSKVYAIMANYIIDAILDTNPDATVGELPLSQFKLS